jgi:alpha-L-fucosidase
MQTIYRISFCFVWILILASCSQPEPPLPYGATPSEGQLQWHNTDFYGMICLSTNTYTDQEWGFGDEPASLFNPDKFDAQQMVGQMKVAGMKGVLVVAKHHGGFCLWPTATTDYSVKTSPWRDGKGDMLRELADAAQQAGMKFGVYLSPWDRNDPDYGTPAYIERYRAQLRELHANYGDIFLSWFDGANSGDGYYGGAREHRQIDRQAYYDWDSTWALIRQLQPHSAIFSDSGPDVRWVGNEKGIADVDGYRNNKHWMPAECDVPIRPGWFYHAAENHLVKSPETLFDLYFASVGRGCALDLGLAPDKSGQLHPADVKSMQGLGRLLSETFSHDLAAGARVKASETRGNSKHYSASNLTDNNKNTYWSTGDETTVGKITVEFSKPTRFNIVSLREYLPLGQRIDSVSVEVFDGANWQLFSKAASIGACRLFRGEPLETSAIRINTWGQVCPALSELGVYLEPQRIAIPTVSRDLRGTVSVANLNPYTTVRYTLDGSDPSTTSEKYTQPIDIPNGGTLKLTAYSGKKAGEVLLYEYGMAKANWKAITGESDRLAFDEDPFTCWTAQRNKLELCIDLGAETIVSSAIYTPPTDETAGLVVKYEVYAGKAPNRWGQPVAKGEFGNIRNNPLPQTIRFEKPVSARYLRFVATETVDSEPMAVAEIDVLLK